MTCGEMPYGRAKNPEVVERVQRGQILSRPPSCPHKVYEVTTWSLQQILFQGIIAVSTCFPLNHVNHIFVTDHEVKLGSQSWWSASVSNH